MANFQEKLESLGPGKLLTSIPLDAMIAMLGSGIARAQESLDKRGIAAAEALGQTMLELPDPKDASVKRARSLFTLGFLPTFYQFSKATLELKVDMHYEVGEKTDIGGGGNIDGKVGPVAFAANVKVDDTRKFDLKATLMTHVTLDLVCVPPPAAFVEYLRSSLKV